VKDVAIRVAGVSKRYRLGHIGATTLRDDLRRWWARARRRPDPTLKLDEADAGARRDGEFWALKDVTFDVGSGEVLGIVGRNGAGKSTLLKILSRITAPTEGRALLRGRVASLLEVGTGFHGELTGRENVYLNGAVLGMSRAEVRRKLDAIVAFSGCERFIDTPVRRYSSGMMVRLGFAVAAHLEPEILIVDEVLAVGDAEFQQRCLGKMRDVAGRGRTVLFVSHNMTAVESLCSRALLLEQGRVVSTGLPAVVIGEYLGRTQARLQAVAAAPPVGLDEAPRIEGARLVPAPGADPMALKISDAFDLVVDYWNPREGTTLHVNLLLYAEDGSCALNSYSDAAPRARGAHRATCRIPGDLLNARTYSVRLLLVRDFSHALCDLDAFLTFVVHEGQRQLHWFGHWPGVVRPQLEWRTTARDAPGEASA
jgi:lipopolysaccharide transport system ATP-binding protein